MDKNKFTGNAAKNNLPFIDAIQAKIPNFTTKNMQINFVDDAFTKFGTLNDMFMYFLPNWQIKRDVKLDQSTCTLLPNEYYVITAYNSCFVKVKNQPENQIIFHYITVDNDLVYLIANNNQ